MKIFITIPGWKTPHGGLRVIIEWANRLSKWHDVYLHNLRPDPPCYWMDIDPKVNICGIEQMWECDTVIFTSPHSVPLFDMVLPNQKVFTFLQMMEHLFQPSNQQWLSDCKRFYTSPYPMFSISKWNIRWMTEKFGRTSPIHYIGCGVNTEDFPVEKTEKFGKVVLIEGWECGNPSKDSDYVAHEVARRLRADGYIVKSYGALNLVKNKHLLNYYQAKPTLEHLNNLYREATILVKATKYDARACAPMESMTKGTVTARAIIEGDDDLMHEVNCLRSGYDADQLYANAKRLLTDHELRERLANACIDHVSTYSWSYWIGIVNDIISA